MGYLSEQGKSSGEENDDDGDDDDYHHYYDDYDDNGGLAKTTRTHPQPAGYGRSRLYVSMMWIGNDRKREPDPDSGRPITAVKTAGCLSVLL